MPDDSRPAGSRWDVLTQTGAGTPMGELLRRYWWPIAGASEFGRARHQAGAAVGRGPRPLQGSRRPLRPARPALPASPRRSQLRLCRGMRAALQLPRLALRRRRAPAWRSPTRTWRIRSARLKDEIRIKAYPVEELGGLLWAYLGPEPRPLVPDWEFFSWPNGFRQIVMAEIPCNWFQCQENSIDPVHFEWTHSNWSVRLGGAHRPLHAAAPQGRFQRVRVRLPVQAHPHGHRRARPRCGQSAASACGRRPVHRQPFRVPRADRRREHAQRHLGISAACRRSASPMCRTASRPGQGPIADPATGRWITSHVMNQDFVTWVGQGRIADRSKEYLAPSDRGIVMIRRRFLDDLEAVAARAGTPRRSCATPRSTARSRCRSPSARSLIEASRAEHAARPVQPPQPARLHLPDRAAARGARGVSRRDGLHRSGIAVRDAGPVRSAGAGRLRGKPR